eukprot:TRINITY_DN1433_c0_g1_i2.p1 TRINITY_DN1433_c0_g1~~TRINITY_DN1433_c0_g1_i2.p1  ORF type:complete len:441 (-),score=90.71 TRINITY_DN1433_c0_g1_i2:788-2110(-)
MSHEQVAAIKEVHESRGAKVHASRIFNGGLHLRRLIPIKDMLVPSGPRASMWGAVFNMIKATIGAGLLGVPLATRYTGIGLGVILMVMLALISGTTIYMMTAAGEYSSASSYEVLSFKALGMKGSRLVDILIIIGGFGSLVAYHMLIVDFLQPVIIAISNNAETVAANKFLITAVVNLALLLPLAVKKNINSLRFTSFVSLLLIVMFVVVVVYFGVVMLDVRGMPSPLNVFHLDMTLFNALPMYAFSFMSQSSVFPIYVEMQEHTVSAFSSVVVRTQIFSLIVFVLTGVFGYIAFGDGTMGNVITNFPRNSPLVLSIQVAFALIVIFSYPLVLFTFRLSIEHLWHGIEGRFNTIRFYILTIATIVVASVVAMFVSNVSFVFSLTGSVSSGALMMTLPAIAYIRIMPDTMRSPLKIAAVCIAVLGVVILVLGVTSSILSML